MRFNRLAIPAYGPFTGLSLVFPRGEMDFHVLYGRNEAGKSSLLRAIRDLLYGIHAQTPDNFIHDYKDLRITAEIQNRVGQRLALQRRKGQRNTLLDAAEQPLADSALQPFLGPVGREFFTTMFGLGAEELRQGAHDLLQGKGDLGQALFSASLAGTPVHRVLEKLEAEARSLFNGRARVGVSLRPAVEAYEEALRASKQALIKAETWEETLRELEDAGQAKAGLEAEYHTLRARLDWLQRCLDALPALGQLRENQARLAALPPLPDLPSGYAAAAQAGREGLAQAEGRLRDLNQRIAELEGRRQALQPDAALLARAAEIDALVAGLAIHRQERDALAADQATAAQLRAGLERGLLELGIAEDLAPEAIGHLRIPLAEQLALRAAAQALAEAESASAAHHREAERLTAEREKTERQLARLPQSEVAALRDAHAASAALPNIVGKAANLTNLARRLASQQQLLAGAPADPAAIHALVLPAAARLRAFEAAASDLAARTREWEIAQKETARQLRDMRAKLAALEKRGALPTLESLAEAREQREAGWQQVLASWKHGQPEADWNGTPLSQAYPAAVHHADALADQLREDADAIAQAEDLRARIRELEANELEQERQRLQAAREAWQRDWLQLWQATGLPAGSPAEMLEWREHWLEFRNRYEAWRDLRDELDAARQAIDAAEANLRPLLDAASGDLAALRERAEQRLRLADQVLGERRVLEARLAELREAEDSHARRQPAIDAALSQAQSDWRAQPLGGEQRPETALSLLEARIALIAQYDTWTRLEAAIAQRQAALEIYARQAASLAPGEAVLPCEVTVHALREALAEARALHARRGQVEEELAQWLAGRPSAEAAVATARAAMAALLAQAQVADMAALDQLLSDLAIHQALLAECDRLRATLHVQARGEPLDQFAERVARETAENLVTEQQDLAARLHEREVLREQAIQTLARAEDAKARLEASGDVAAAQLQSARHAAARIRQDAARYLRLRLAIRFLQEQIEAFRARNQGPLLARAGALFQRMTGGSFSGLGTDYAPDDTPRLVGRKDDRFVPVEGMSEGTRDQLYLALRLAAIEQHQINHEAMPLILDDLLITFDDERCRAILALLHELSGQTQVLLFTHHQHLLDLVRETLPNASVYLHRLGA